jgi:hypothetical protein
MIQNFLARRVGSTQANQALLTGNRVSDSWTYNTPTYPEAVNDDPLYPRTSDYLQRVVTANTDFNFRPAIAISLPTPFLSGLELKFVIRRSNSDGSIALTNYYLYSDYPTGSPVAVYSSLTATYATLDQTFQLVTLTFPDEYDTTQLNAASLRLDFNCSGMSNADIVRIYAFRGFTSLSTNSSNAGLIMQLLEFF